jgi:hypothetical protein
MLLLQALHVAARAVTQQGADSPQKVLNAVALLEKTNRTSRKQRKADLDAGARCVMLYYHKLFLLK